MAVQSNAIFNEIFFSEEFHVLVNNRENIKLKIVVFKTYFGTGVVMALFFLFFIVLCVLMHLCRMSVILYFVDLLFISPYMLILFIVFIPFLMCSFHLHTNKWLKLCK